jgi:antitoxin CptB
MSSATDLDIRRKRLLWRASHRGIKEMDILVGGYAARELPQMRPDDLATFEGLMDIADQDLLAYATGQASIPSSIDCAMLRDILAIRS